MKVVSCLEQNFGLDVSDEMIFVCGFTFLDVSFILSKGACCSQVLVIVVVDDVETDVESCGLGMCRLPLLPSMLGSIAGGC